MNAKHNAIEAPGSAPVTPRLDSVADYIGRVAVAVLFVDAARYHLTAGGWEKTLADMQARGVPLPIPALLLAMIASIVLSIALVLNVRARWAARGLALYAIGVSLVMYTPFVGLGQVAFILFLKDLCIFGGLLSLSCNLPDSGWRPTLVRKR